MSGHAYNTDDLVEDESHQVVASYFIGPKAENFEWFKKCLLEILEIHRDARLDYYPRDGKVISQRLQDSFAFRQSRRKMTNAFRQAAYLLGKHSIPFWSPRYQGHMCMDLAIPAMIGYFMTMMYNPNNVTIEVAPFTTVAEIQVGQDLCNLFGYNTDPNSDQPEAWGHITCDGTIANLESVWVARNLKFYALSIRKAMKEGGPLHFIEDKLELKTCMGKPKLLRDMSTWEMLNLRPDTVLDIPEILYRQYFISPKFLDGVMKTYGIQNTSKRGLEEEFGVKDMKYFLSNTRHYSWPKSAAITGIGGENVIGVHVDHGARLDMNLLRKELDHCLKHEIGVYAIVAIIGSTEEGAVDPLAKILKVREEYQEKGLSFLVHGDGAWGGYFCTMLPTGWNPGVPLFVPTEETVGEGYVPDASLKPQTAEDLFALRFADSVTVDPHKAAYIPYPAGGLCYRDGRMRYLVTWTSPYLSRGETTATSIGVYGAEGSKPGAAVMSTWLANTCIGLGPEGYGRLLGEVTFTCNRLSAEWAAMSTKDDPFIVVPLNELPSELKGLSEEEVEEERQMIRDRVISKTNLQIATEDKSRPHGKKTMEFLRDLGSDLNINVFSANWRYADGRLNDDVEEANYFNQLIIQDLSVDSPEDEPTKIPFFLTSTTFLIHEYGECAQHFKKRLHLLQDDTDILVMRNVVMSPWPTDGYFINSLIQEYRRVLTKHVETCRKRNDTSPQKHEFLLQGTDKLYAIHFPMFNLEKHRRQFIFEVQLPEDAKKVYLEEKQSDPEGLFILSSVRDISLETIAVNKESFMAVVSKRLHKRADPKPGEPIYAYRKLVEDTIAKTVSVVKYRHLKAQYRDSDYPDQFVPFYLYGTKQSLNIDHILVKSPNISLTAENVTLTGDVMDKISDDQLARGCILLIDGLNEAAMQPFQSTEGQLSDTFDANQGFFFAPGKNFKVSVYEDPRGVDENGPGLVDVHKKHHHSSASSEATHGHGVNGASNATTNGATDGPKVEFKLIGSGDMTLGKGRYIDSVHINEDPFYIPEGTDKYKKWKSIFDQIGKELY